MKLFYSPTSPYVRKVLVCALELGLGEAIERLPSAAHPVNRDNTIITHNPLGQVPTLVTAEGAMLADSRVICEYLDHLGGGKLFPAKPDQRWTALVDQSMADGLLTAALLARYESAVRPPEFLWKDWLAGQMDKVEDVLAYIDRRVQQTGQQVDIGTISFACALSYLDLRFADSNWRARHAHAAAFYATFSQRPSMVATPLG